MLPYMSRRSRLPPDERSYRCENSASRCQPRASTVSTFCHSFARSGAAFISAATAVWASFSAFSRSSMACGRVASPRETRVPTDARISCPRSGALVKLASSHACPSSSFSRGASSTARTSDSSFSSASPSGTPSTA
jgi:hypothetical protein